ncbi:MAG: hypothetical protein AAF889_02860 [Cyanobacteria bacterium P01_D01_bin.73]
MHLRPSTLLITLMLSAGAAFAEVAPAQAGINPFQETYQEAQEAPANSTEARRRYRRRTRTSHRGSGRRQMIRHILATEA